MVVLLRLWGFYIRGGKESYFKRMDVFIVVYRDGKWKVDFGLGEERVFRCF